VIIIVIRKSILRIVAVLEVLAITESLKLHFIPMKKQKEKAIEDLLFSKLLNIAKNASFRFKWDI
jgi:hypothetical protein